MRNKYSRLVVGGLIGLLQLTSTYAASQLTFDGSAKPDALVLGGVDLFTSHSSSGFHLRYFDGEGITDILLSNIATSGNEVTVSHPDGLPSLTFRIDTYDNHLAIHLIGVQGIAANDRSWGMNLILRSNATVSYFSLDDVAGNSHSSPFSAGTNIQLKWRHLWGSNYAGKRGSFVLYNGSLSGSALDAVLAEIWSTQNAAGYMVRPAGQATWTESDVLAWVASYAAKLNDMSGIQMEASSLTELYNLTDTYVIPNNIKRVYLHTATWRGEYWPNFNSRVHVNTDVFPNGKPDLKTYADYLKANGVMLRLHSVSSGIGKNDPDYVVGGVDARLASWGSGTLADAINSTEKTIRFVPGVGVTSPLLGINISHTGKRLYYEYVKIGDEIIKVGKFTRMDDEVWILENCTRGMDGTNNASHTAAAAVVGLYRSYGTNYIPEYDLDQPSGLLDELALEYATFVNDLELGHLHFDGPEIHDIYPWAIRDFLDRIYSYVEHPTTSSRVGRRIAAHFEQEFSAVRDDKTYAYFPLEIGLRLEYLSKPKLATSILDTHFHVEDGILLGGRRLTLTVPQSGLGIDENVLATHGLSSEVMQVFDYWLELTPVFDDADAAYIASMTQQTSGSSHYESEDVLVLGKDVNDDYIFTPHRIMGRSSGVDEPYHIEQEWGAVPRFQEIAAGTTMTLTNPYVAQEPQVVIRVVETSTTLQDPLITVNGAGTLSVTGDVDPGEYMKYTGGTTVNVYDNNWNFQHTLPAVATNFTVNNGNNDVKTEAGGGGAPNLMVQYITLGPVYVLQSNNNL